MTTKERLRLARDTRRCSDGGIIDACAFMHGYPGKVGHEDVEAPWFDALGGAPSYVQRHAACASALLDNCAVAALTRLGA